MNSGEGGGRQRTCGCSGRAEDWGAGPEETRSTARAGLRWPGLSASARLSAWMRARLRPGSGWAGPGFRTALGSNYTDCDPKRPGRTAAAKTSARSPGANFITGPWFPGETAHPEFQPASWPTERLALTPLPQHATLAQLRSDLPQSVGGVNRGGRSLQGEPVRKMYKTASTNNRLSAAVCPQSVTFRGSISAIRAHWSSRKSDLSKFIHACLLSACEYMQRIENHSILN